LFGEALKQKEKPNVVIDNTNSSIENRKKFIDIAKNNGV
jgi:predicted kinase